MRCVQYNHGSRRIRTDRQNRVVELGGAQAVQARARNVQTRRPGDRAIASRRWESGSFPDDPHPSPRQPVRTNFAVVTATPVFCPVLPPATPRRSPGKEDGTREARPWDLKGQLGRVRASRSIRAGALPPLRPPSTFSVRSAGVRLLAESVKPRRTTSRYWGRPSAVHGRTSALTSHRVEL